MDLKASIIFMISTIVYFIFITGIMESFQSELT